MRNLFLFLCLMSLFSCADPSDQLVGKWTAVSVIQDTKKVDIDLTLVGFEFDEDGTYEFRSTLDYREAGAYEVMDKKLVTKDTIHGESEKSVLIEKFEADTLVLKMKNPEGWMVLRLSRD